MIWLSDPCVPPDLTPRGVDLPGTVVSIGPVGAHENSLFPEERRYVERAVPARRQQFASARLLARRAFTRLGYPANAIPMAPSRAPQWPRGLVGSLSHCDDFAVAVVSRRSRSVGVDIEQTGRLRPDTFGMVFTAPERAEGLKEPRATAIFSAKEALFKAIHPISGFFVGFQEVEVELDLPGQSFTARYVGLHPENQLIDQMQGLITTSENRVLSIALL